MLTNTFLIAGNIYTIYITRLGTEDKYLEDDKGIRQ